MQEGSNSLGEKLIFIISQPRAGSTLLHRILSGHAEILSIAEPWIMLHPVYALKQNGINAEYDSSLARKGLDDFLSQFSNGQELYYKALRNFANTMYGKATELCDKRFFLDKTPRYYNIIPDLYQIFPNAKFIFLLRNPMAVLSSVLKTWRKNQPTDLVKSANWADVIKAPALIAEGLQVLKDKAIIVRYEDMVNLTEQIIQKLCANLNIQFSLSMLEYGGKQPPSGRFGDQVGIVKHSSAVPSYVEKWVDNLSAPELYEFSLNYLKELGAELLSALGYSYADILEKLNSTCHETKNQCFRENNNKQPTPKNGSASNENNELIFVQKCEAEIRKNPLNAEAHNNLAILYCRMGNDEKALNHFYEALNIRPESIIFKKNLADFHHFRLGNLKEALKLYVSILTANPVDIEALLAAGNICEVVKKPEDAQFFYNRVLEIDPQNSNAEKYQSKVKEMMENKHIQSAQST